MEIWKNNVKKELFYKDGNMIGIWCYNVILNRGYYMRNKEMKFLLSWFLLGLYGYVYCYLDMDLSKFFF